MFTLQKKSDLKILIFEKNQTIKKFELKNTKIKNISKKGKKPQKGKKKYSWAGPTPAHVRLWRLCEAVYPPTCRCISIPPQAGCHGLLKI
jgi:hypothetical protein